MVCDADPAEVGVGVAELLDSSRATWGMAMAGASRAAIAKTRVVARIAVKYMARSKLKVEKATARAAGRRQ